MILIHKETAEIYQIIEVQNIGVTLMYVLTSSPNPKIRYFEVEMEDYFEILGWI